MNTPDSSGWSQRTQIGIVGSTMAGFETRNETQRGSIDSPAAKASRSATRPGARRSRRISAPSSRSMISCERSSWVSRLPAGRRGSGGAGKAARTWSSKKWANGPWPTSWSRPATRNVSTTRPSLGIGSPRAPELAPERREELARPQPGLVHDPEAVREPRVLGRREHPARALELADPAQPLDPGRVEQVLLGRVLVGQSGRRGLLGGQPLRQLDVGVDRVADQVDRAERVARHQAGAFVPGPATTPALRRSAPRARGVRRGDVVPQLRRLQHLDVVAPRQDPDPDLDRAGDASPARQRAVSLLGDPLARVPARLADAARDGRREAQHDLDPGPGPR